MASSNTAGSNSVVTLDQQYIESKQFDRKKVDSKKVDSKKGARRSVSDKYGLNHSHPARKTLYKHHSKEALSPQEVEQLIKAALHSPRSGLRDAAIILLAYRHGLKVSELINLKWEHIDFENRSILVSRLRNGRQTLHPLEDREIDMLSELDCENSELVFQTQRKHAMSSTSIRNIIKHAGEEAGFEKTVYPNMLSGAAGFDLIANTLEAAATRH